MYVGNVFPLAMLGPILTARMRVEFKPIFKIKGQGKKINLVKLPAYKYMYIFFSVDAFNEFLHQGRYCYSVNSFFSFPYTLHDINFKKA